MSAGGLPAAEPDLVVVALSGVQRFIAESRTTSDLRSGSVIIAGLASAAAAACAGSAELVFPAGEPGGEGLPNRVVALAPAGTGPQVAGRAVRAVDDEWARAVRLALGLAAGADVPVTPGVPSVQWVCVPAGDGGYPGQWRRAQAVLDARKRISDFGDVEAAGRDLCQLSPRWPAQAQAPPKARRHERAEKLSVASWAKRLLPRIPGSGLADEGAGRFPSTASIASAVYRREVLNRIGADRVATAVGALRRAVTALDATAETAVAGLPRADGEMAGWFRSSAGPWVYPDRWLASALAREHKTGGQRDGDFAAVVSAGQTAAKRLQELMAADYEIEPPAAYLAVLMQDLDGMGAFLGGEGRDLAGEAVELTPAGHRRVSAELRGAASAQRGLLESVSEGLLGVPVYAGGDDLLAFTAAATALVAAERLRMVSPAGLPTASTAVLFFHHGAALRHVLAEARSLLEQAKQNVPGKHALGVGFLRRSGFREQSIQPWRPAELAGAEAAGAGPGEAVSTAGAFSLFARDRQRRLSPRLVSVLERDGGELAGIGPARVYRAEMRRLVGRHGGDRDDADALIRLGRFERSRSAAPVERELRLPAPAARVAVFLRQECR